MNTRLARSLAAFLSFFALLGLSACPNLATNDVDSAEVVVSGERVLMGTRFAVQVVAQNAAKGEDAIEGAFDDLAALEGRISEWRDDSEISALNRHAGDGPFKVGADLFTILSRGSEISRLTGGALDLTFAACGGLWSTSKKKRPTPEDLQACLPRVDYRRIGLSHDGTTVTLEPGTRIGIGAIGKGYGIDQAARYLKERGYTNYLVDGGGDIRVSGTRLGRPWSLGIAHPREKGALLGAVQMRSGALASSGDYERYYMENGVRYHHILDPSTGKPARASTGVSVMAPTAMEADALATAFFVMGPKASVALAERLPGVEVLVVDPKLFIHTSEGFPLKLTMATQPPI